MHFRSTYESLPWLRCKSGAKEHSSHLSHNNKRNTDIEQKNWKPCWVRFPGSEKLGASKNGRMERNFPVISGILGQPCEVHLKFRNEIPENVCSICSQTRNFRNFWSNGKRPSCSLENVRLFDHLTLTFSCPQQCVQINQTCSSLQTIKCGVPQGSILGPLFFILYINDLPKASKLTELLLFADDTSIFFSHSNPNYLENVLNNELLNIDVWLRCNKLSVNIKKTNYVTFSPSQRKLNHSFSLFFGGQPLIQSNVTKFLGLYLDGHLTWKYHINFVCQQIAKSIGILSRTHFYLSC